MTSPTKRGRENDSTSPGSKRKRAKHDPELPTGPRQVPPKRKKFQTPQGNMFSRLVFYGTSSASPQPDHRNVSSCGIQLDSGDILLIDCGEGTQTQIMKSTTRASKIKAVLFTHLHGDHCYGIFGLIKMLSHNGRSDPLWIVGPPGMQRM